MQAIIKAINYKLMINYAGKAACLNSAVQTGTRRTRF
jgi:hypothetical protein